MDILNTQNFLHSKKLVSQLVAMSNLGADDVVLEIGPGKGIITEQLSLVCRQVFAVEYDKDYANKLIIKYSGSEKVCIVSEDILKYRMNISGEYKLFSNIPFTITSDIMTKFLSDNRVQEIYFIMQYEAFLRFCGTPLYQDSYKSLLYKPFFSMEIIHRFAPSDFTPMPSARIVFVHIARKNSFDISHTDLQVYQDFLSYLFMAKGEYFSDKLKLLFTYEQIKRIMRQIQITKQSKISDITYDKWLQLFRIFLSFVSQDKKDKITNAYRKMLASQSTLEKQHRNRSSKKEW